jgi:flagellar hook-basal body complex protein FliE
MNIASIGNITDYNNIINSEPKTSENRNTTFDNLFQSALNMVNDTNKYSNDAEQAETDYAAGLTDNYNELMVTQQKANMSLQYTIAVRNHVLDAYKELMNLQF